MQDVVPPASRENLRNHNGDPGIRLFVEEILDVVEEGTQDRTCLLYTSDAADE